MNLDITPANTDAELLAAVERGVDAGLFLVWTPDQSTDVLLEWMAGTDHAENERKADALRNEWLADGLDDSCPVCFADWKRPHDADCERGARQR